MSKSTSLHNLMENNPDINLTSTVFIYKFGMKRGRGLNVVNIIR